MRNAFLRQTQKEIYNVLVCTEPTVKKKKLKLIMFSLFPADSSSPTEATQAAVHDPPIQIPLISGKLNQITNSFLA